MENKYKIYNPSNELIVYAVQNPPKDPERIYLNFLANNVKIPFSPYKDGELGNYLRLCEEGNIIPFSSKKIGYDFEVKEKIPVHPEGAGKFFGNGRTNRVQMDISNYFNEERMNLFERILFPSLLENNYKISEGFLTLSGHKVGSHENEGYEPDLELRINWGGKGFELLLLDSYVKKEDEAKYEKWFKDLKKKFSV